MRRSVDNIVSRMTDDVDYNKKLFINEFGTLYYTDENDNNLCHLLYMSDSGNIEKKIDATKMLLDYGIDPNATNSWGNTFMHIVANGDYGISDVLTLLDMAIEKGFDVNAKNKLEHTILHHFLLCMKDANRLYCVMKSLSMCGFDFNVVDRLGRSFEHCIDSITRFSPEIRQKLKELLIECRKGDEMTIDEFKNAVKDYDNTKIDDKDITYPDTVKENTPGVSEDISVRLKKKKTDNSLPKVVVSTACSKVNNYGTILTEKKYPTQPAYGREDEIKKIILTLASNKKLPLLVGPSGVGKTTIVDQLAYLIINNKVSDFLKNRPIYELYINDIIEGTSLRGDFEKSMKEVMNMAIKYDMIVFIDEFHMLFGAGAGIYDKTDGASIIKRYIDRNGLIVIGATTTGEYETYVADNSLARRFDVIRVNELAEDKLAAAIANIFKVFAKQEKITISEDFSENMDKIINILITLTRDNNRKYDDKIHNPDLVVGIIDRAFAYPKANNDIILNVKDLIMAIDDNERLYPWAKETAIKNLNYLERIKVKKLTKNKIVDFSQFMSEYGNK